MRKIWLLIALYNVAVLFSMAPHRTNAQVGGCFNGVRSMPAVSAAPILKLGKFAPTPGSLPQPSSINGRRSESGDANYTGGDLSNTASPPNCNVIIYPSNVPRIAGPSGTAFPQIFNATNMRFILAVEERADDDGDGQNEFTQLQSLTLNFYSNDGCSSSAPNLFQSFNIPVSDCTLVTGYYVFSLSSQQAAALQPSLDQANNSAEDNTYCIYVGATMMVSRDDQFNTESNAGEILYVGNNTASGCNFNSLSSTGKTFAGSGGTGAFQVTSNGCLWNVSGAPSWITLHTSPYGNANETVSYSVQPNPTGSTRSATLTVTGAIIGIVPITYTVTQTCNAIAPDSQTFGSNGGNSAINVTPQGPGCGWLATESLSWVNITSGASGTSPGSIAYTVAANTQANAPGRSGVIDISGFAFEVKQAGPGGDCATLPITAGQSLTGTLSSGDCLSTVASPRPADRYSFAGTVGQRVSISLGNAFSNATFALISPGGAVLTSSSQPLELPDAGVYTIEIYSSTANTFGSYTVSLCGYTINGDDLFFGPNNRFVDCVEVIEQGSCSYEISTGGLGWLSIFRSGNFVCVRAQDNLGDSRRTGVVIIAGKTIRVEQEPTDTFAVYSQADSGDGSLRKAITGANAVNRTATITFDFFPAGPRTISPTTALPIITNNNVIIDGTTQPGYAGKPLIELDGSAAGFTHGLEISNNGCQVKGLVINRFQRNGILMNCDFSEIANCYIGTDLNGTLDRGNTENGIRVTGTANFIHDNLISGNNGAGIVSTSFGSGFFDAAIVQGNRIGTNAAGTAGIGNSGHGIDADGAYTRIGDASPGAGNTIAFNGGIGVRITGGFAHSIIGNSIHSNGGLGIDLGGDGVTANDLGDGDFGVNNLQNFPVVTSAVSSGGNTTIQGTFNGSANQFLRIEIFSNNLCDASGNGEAQVFLGFTDVNTNGSGNASFSLIVPTNSINGPYLTATATNNNNGNTSEFSQCLSTCIPTLSAMSPAFPGNTGVGTPSLSGSIGVTLPAGCNWTAVSNDSFIVITGGGSGTGNGTITYSLSANPSNTTPRTGTISVAGKTVTVLQGPQFLDVPTNYLFYTEIGKLAARGVTLGCGSGNYCPDFAVTREQMAAFLLRALGEPNPPTPGFQRFSDVPPSNIFYNFIDRLAELQITLGCGGGNYCPLQAVTREQMAAFLLRAKGEFNPPLPASQRFNDVPPSNIFYNFIDRLAELQITSGCSANPPLYCPGQSVTRGQMAAFLVRAFGL